MIVFDVFRMLLEERDYIHDLEMDGMNWYRLCNCRSFDRSCSIFHSIVIY